MFGNYFYHERVRRSVAIFGRVFNDIYVLRKNSSGAVISTVKVPLSYAPKNKFLDRIREQADLASGQRVALKLPRMSFEIVSYTYDPTRQLQKTSNFMQTGATADKRAKINTYVPYNITFQLNIYAKTQDDALQIVEQIMPYFAPQYNLSMSPISAYPDLKEDVPITLQSVDFADDFEGDVATRRTIIYTLTFEMKANFYGPIADKNVITKAIPKIDLDDIGTADSDYLTITITPTPAGVSADSDYGFSEVYNYELE